jgi:thiamine biosynthesis lipoprotein
LIHRAAREAMRCRFELLLDGDDERFLRAAADEALDEVTWWESRLSRFRRDSLVAHLERHALGRPVAVDPEFFELLAVAEAVRQASGGAFDVAHASGGGLRLDADSLTVELEPPTDGSEVRLDLGAIGKGFAIDQAVARLREAGVERALLHGGTSTVFALGAPPGTPGWRIAFRGLPGLESVRLCDAACSVSAQHGRRLADGTGHVRDPRRSRAAERITPVAVRAPSATLADAWSTALLVDPRRAAAAYSADVAMLAGLSPTAEP